MKTKEEALEIGEQMLKEISNSGHWKIFVWENLGWHVCLENPDSHTVIYYDEGCNPKYSVSVSIDKHDRSDEIFWGANATPGDNDINVALENKLKVMGDFIKSACHVVSSLQLTRILPSKS